MTRSNPLDWRKPRQSDTHDGLEVLIATSGDRLYTLMVCKDSAELCVVTSESTILKRTDFRTMQAAMVRAEEVEHGHASVH